MKAQQMAMKLVSKILGDGQITMPSPDDNHPVFIQVFKDALDSAQNDPEDPFYESGKMNLPLLANRLAMQQQLFAIQQQQMMQQQMAMQAQAQGPQRQAPPKKDESKQGAGGAMQAAQGPQGNLS